MPGQVFATGQTALTHDVADEPAYCAQTLDRSAVPGGQIAFLALRTAQDWHRSGHLHQAADLLLQLLRRHPHSNEAQTARAATLKLAKGYEAAGFRRLAMGVVERLERVSPTVGDAAGRRTTSGSKAMW